MSLLNPAEAKVFLNITEPVDDAVMQDYLDGVQATIAERVGPLEPTVVTERVRPSGATLMLTTPPVISLTSVTPSDGPALTIGDLDVDEDGIVEFISGQDFISRKYTVVYTAGRPADECPDDLVLAFQEHLRVMWSETQRGGGLRPGPAAPGRPANTLPGSARELSDKVTSLIQDHLINGFS